MSEHLPALQIVVPMIAAPICVLLRRRALVWPFALAAAWTSFGSSILLLRRVLQSGPWSYAMGGWAAPYGIEYRADAAGAFVVFFVAALGAIVLTYAPRSVDREIPRGKHHLFCAAYLLCMTGLQGIAITGDLFNVFVFLEISALSSYALISLGAERRALTATFQYLVMGTIGATFILIGVGLLFMMKGTLNMVDMAQRLQPEGQRTALVAFAFLSVGIATKMALFPLHLWLPNAYTYAPSVVTAFLAATSTKVSVYIGLRFIFHIFGESFAFERMPLDATLMPLALMGIVVASAVAIFQTNVKRLLAYSSIAQIGYMVLGISLATETGLTGGIVHLFNHAITKGGLFLAMGCIAYRIGSVRLEDMRGLGRRMPVTMFLWVLGGLSLIGVPGTAGFVSKWYLVLGALQSGFWPVAVLLLLSSLLAVAYVWRVVETAYFREPPEGSKREEAPLSLLLPACALIAATVYFGFETSLTADVAKTAASQLLGGRP